MNVLIVAPHADDEILGCGGIISRYLREGANVYIVVVTNASVGAPELFSSSTVESIRAEGLKSHAFLGVTKTFFLDFPAPKLETHPSYQISNAICKLLLDLKIDTMFIPHRGDMHRDHAVVYHAALVAARPINDCSVKLIYTYETLSETEWAPPFGDDAFIPNVFFDITKDIENKVKAMEFYASQLKIYPHPRSVEIIKSLAKYRGATVGYKFAEAFMLVRAIL
jgi:LmbE family N-acetylglucosaminyl deacetylase